MQRGLGDLPGRPWLYAEQVVGVNPKQGAYRLNILRRYRGPSAFPFPISIDVDPKGRSGLLMGVITSREPGGFQSVRQFLLDP